MPIDEIDTYEIYILPPDSEADCLAFAVGGAVFVVDQGDQEVNRRLAKMAAQQTVQN